VRMIELLGTHEDGNPGYNGQLLQRALCDPNVALSQSVGVCPHVRSDVPACGACPRRIEAGIISTSSERDVHAARRCGGDDCTQCREGMLIGTGSAELVQTGTSGARSVVNSDWINAKCIAGRRGERRER
jgi:hypothetical protein